MSKLDQEIRDRAAATELAKATAVVATVMPATTVAGTATAWDDLISGADEYAGYTLQKDKSLLVGVPFCITGVVYRDGVQKEKGKPTNYVSIELTIANVETINRLVEQGRLDAVKAMRLTPNELIVINDGSTGIARQVTAYLHSKGLIQVPAGNEDGGMGESRYDTYRKNWESPKFDDDEDYRIDGIRLICMRGLRSSEYKNELTADKEAATYYIA